MTSPAAPRRFPARGFMVLIGLATGVVILGALHAVSSIAGPAFLALTLAIAVSPVRTWLVRRGAPAWVCVATPVLLVVVLLVVMVGALAVTVAQLTTLLPTYADSFQALTTSISTQLQRLGVEPQQVQNSLEKADPTKLVAFAAAMVASVLDITSAMVMIIVLVVAMTVDATALDQRVSKLATERPHLVDSLHKFAGQTCRYLLVATVFGLIVAALDTAALLLLGVPLPLLWGLLAFITNYVPNVGFLIGLAPPALLALLDAGTGTMLAVIATYIVFNFVIQSLIQPKFAGKAAGLSVTLTILSLIVWTWVLGPLGAILAIPLTSFARAVLLDSDDTTHWASELIGAAPSVPKRSRRTPAVVPSGPDQSPEGTPAPAGGG